MIFGLLVQMTNDMCTWLTIVCSMVADRPEILPALKLRSKLMIY